MSSAKEGQEVQETSCSEYSSQCPAKDETCVEVWRCSGTRHEIPPRSSSLSSLPPRNPPPRPPWSSAFGRLPGSCPGLCPHSGTTLLWGRETMALWDLWILKQQPSKNDYHPTCAFGLVSAGRISHVGTHERKQKMLFFFLPGWFITSCLNLTRCLQCWKRWKDEGFIYLKSYETFLWWGTSGKGRPKAEATRHNLNLCGWSSWTDPLVSPLWTPQRGLMPPCSHLSSASWHHRRLRSLNPLGQQCGGGSAGDCCAFPAT